MPTRKVSAAQVQELCRRYVAGESAKALGRAFGFTCGTVLAVLRRNNVPIRSHRESCGGLKAEQEAEVCRRYAAGENTIELGKAFCIAPRAITRTLIRKGVHVRGNSEARGGLTPEQEAEVCRRYEEGESAVELGKAFGVTTTTICRILERRGVERRSLSEAKGGLNNEQADEVCRRYKAGENTVDLGEIFGVAPSAINRVLRRKGVCIRTNSEAHGGLKPELEPEVCRRYEEGENTVQLGKAFGVKAGTIGKILERNGIERRNISEAKGGLNSEQEAEVCRRYEEGESTNELGKAFGVYPGTIGKILERNGVARRSNREAHGGLDPEQAAEVCSRYEEGENTIQLGKAFGVSSVTIRNILDRNGVTRRSLSEACGWVTSEQEAEVCRRYEEGESTIQLGKAFGFTDGTIGRILNRNGVTRRSLSEAKGGLSAEQEAEVCRRYEEGENTYELGKAFGLSPSTIVYALKRNTVELRASGIEFGDSVQHILNGTGLHIGARECEFYLFGLARYSNTHCKPGIAFDTELRADHEYGENFLQLWFSTRAEAFFLEQAVLDATRGYADCPDDMQGWTGKTEVRAMPAADLLPIALRLADELEDLGPWEFAACYVPMTAAQRLQCQQRAMQLQEVA